MSAEDKAVTNSAVVSPLSPSSDSTAPPNKIAPGPPTLSAVVSSEQKADSELLARPDSALVTQTSIAQIAETTGTNGNSPPAPRGPLLQQATEMLYRQVNPTWQREGRITSQVFNPFPKDKGLLSVTREQMTSPEAAYNLFTSRGLLSVGVVAVKVEECSQTALDAYHDPEDKVGFEDPAHSVIDFRALIDMDKERKRRAQVLADKAKQRGFVYRPS